MQALSSELSKWNRIRIFDTHTNASNSSSCECMHALSYINFITQLFRVKYIRIIYFALCVIIAAVALHFSVLILALPLKLLILVIQITFTYSISLILFCHLFLLRLKETLV